MERQRTPDTCGLALCHKNKTEIQKSRKFHPDPPFIGCMSSSGVHTAHVHPGPQSQTHWEALTGEAIVGAGAGTSGIAVVSLPSMLLSSTGPAAMAHCKTEQEDWLLAHLKYLLFIFNFFFWVSGGCGTPLPTPALWPRSLWSHCTKVGFIPKSETVLGPILPCSQSEPCPGCEGCNSHGVHQIIPRPNCVCNLIHLPCLQNTTPMRS